MSYSQGETYLYGKTFKAYVYKGALEALWIEVTTKQSINRFNRHSHQLPNQATTIKMQFTTVATLLASAATFAAAAPTPSTLKPFSVDGLRWFSSSSTSLSLNITDPNTGTTSQCYVQPLLIGTTTCDSNPNFSYGFSDDLNQISIAVTYPKGTLDDTDAYYIANGTAPTGKTCEGTNAGSDCKGSPHIEVPIVTIQGVA
ncbi:hypothetical protein B0J12DRAFT_742427 [Macrophomina phaseolina]|uniref:Uncharacterized protein n=1 Tax=Macrophomina phaseolina TaxID=35725 RepID=A0ABQ8G4Q6_9PEZI|nr:hypothetical protein B0J12DRAFT_742427 [Macrophomina phaseolina]